MNFERELNCVGYWGFGGGYAKEKGYLTFPDRGLYCNVCPLSDKCWESHRERVRELLPDMTEAFDECLAHCEREGIKNWQAHWYEKVGTPDPYSYLMAGNVEDGSSVALTGKVRDRGPFTLPYPFKVNITGG